MKGAAKPNQAKKDEAPSSLPQLIRIVIGTLVFLVVAVLVGTYISSTKSQDAPSSSLKSVPEVEPEVAPATDKTGFMYTVAERFIDVRVDPNTALSTEGKSVVGSIEPLLNVFKKFKATNEDINNNLRIETNTQPRPQYAGHHVFASRDLKKGDAVVRIPIRSVLGTGLIDELVSLAKIATDAEVPTAGSELSKVVVVPALNRDRIQAMTSFRQNALQSTGTEPTNEEYHAVSLQLPSAPSDADIELGSIYHLMFAVLASAAKGEKHQHPIVSSFPALAHIAQFSAMFASPDETKYCFSPRAATVTAELKGSLNKIRTITETLCTTRSVEEEELVRKYQESGEAPDDKFKMAAYVRAVLCGTSMPMLEWAFNVVMTRSQQEGLHRIFVPILDLLPYVGKPNVAIKQGMTTVDGERYIEVLADTDIMAGDAITLARQVREPMEVLVTHGYFDPTVFEEVGIPLLVSFGESEMADVRKMVERKTHAAQEGREIDSDGDETDGEEEKTTGGVASDDIVDEGALEKALGRRMSEAPSEDGMGLGCTSDISVHTLHPETLALREVTMQCAQLQALRDVYPKIRGEALGYLRDNFTFVTGTLDAIKAEGDIKRLEVAERAIDIVKRALDITQSVHNRRDFFTAKGKGSANFESGLDSDLQSDEEQKRHDSVCDGAKRGFLGEMDAYNGYVVGATTSALEELASETFAF